MNKFWVQDQQNEYVLNSRPKEFQYVLVRDQKVGFYTIKEAATPQK